MVELCEKARAAKLLSKRVVPLVAGAKLKLTLAEFAFSVPEMVFVAPPLVLKLFVVPPWPMGLPPKFIVPPPSPPVKLKAVFFHQPKLELVSANVDVFSTFTLAGLS